MAFTGYSTGIGNAFQGAWGILGSDPEIVDSNTATGPETTDSPPAQITAGVDLGGLFHLTSVTYYFGYEWGPTFALEYSTDHISWSSAATTTWGSHSGVFSLEHETVTINATAAFVRFSAGDDGNSGMTSGHVSIREITPVITGLRRRSNMSFLA